MKIDSPGHNIKTLNSAEIGYGSLFEGNEESVASPNQPIDRTRPLIRSASIAGKAKGERMQQRKD